MEGLREAIDQWFIADFQEGELFHWFVQMRGETLET